MLILKIRIKYYKTNVTKYLCIMYIHVSYKLITIKFYIPIRLKFIQKKNKYLILSVTSKKRLQRQCIGGHKIYI